MGSEKPGTRSVTLLESVNLIHERGFTEDCKPGGRKCSCFEFGSLGIQWGGKAISPPTKECVRLGTGGQVSNPGAVGQAR